MLKKSHEIYPFSEILFPEICPWEIKRLFKGYTKENLCYLFFFFKIETILRVFTVNIYFFYNTKKILPFCICFL